ncbi:hypothetical protein B0H13DRAFT_1907298, partial [Mycena leptocephala]
MDLGLDLGPVNIDRGVWTWRLHIINRAPREILIRNNRAYYLLLICFERPTYPKAPDTILSDLPQPCVGCRPPSRCACRPLPAVLAGIHAQILGYSKGYGSERGYIISSSGDVDVDAVDVPFDRRDKAEGDSPSPSLCCPYSARATNSDTSDANDSLDPEPARAHGLGEDADSVAGSLSLISPALSPCLSSSSSRKDEITPTPHCEPCADPTPSAGAAYAAGAAADAPPKSRPPARTSPTPTRLARG